MIKTYDGWGVWWRWTLASSMGLVIGVPLGIGLAWIALYSLEVQVLLVGAVFGFGVGSALGVAQGIAIRRVLPVAARRWAVMTVAGALGGSIGGALVIAGSERLLGATGWVLAPVSGALLGAIIGLAQRLALPRYFPRGWWVLASSVSWCLGVSLFTGGFAFMWDPWMATAASPGGYSPMLIVGLVACPVVAIVSIGATSGAVMAWLVVRRIPPTSCLSCGYDLRGTAGNICPECGEQSPAVPAPSYSRKS